MDFDDFAIEYGQIEMLVEFDAIPEPETQSVAMDEAVDSLVDDFKEVAITTQQKYKKYGEDQIACFISLAQEEGLTAPKAAEQCGIPRSSAYRLLNEFNAGPGTALSGRVKKQLKPFDDNPSIVLEEHIREKRAISLKQATKYTLARDAPKNY
ncbi:hypothetical protein DFQ28_009696 [Apophysomyces sp. BC1034]|nr:hypothetical protein DFQ28_009696 [Apophysomyces sp. BC1034]